VTSSSVGNHRIDGGEASLDLFSKRNEVVDFFFVGGESPRNESDEDDGRIAEHGSSSAHKAESEWLEIRVLFDVGFWAETLEGGEDR
jgi:hypothetical protein